MSFVALALAVLLVWLHMRTRRRALAATDDVPQDVRAQVVADTTAWTVAGAVSGVVMVTVLGFIEPLGLAGVPIADRAVAGVIMALGCSIVGSSVRPASELVADSLGVGGMTVYAGACFLLSACWLAVTCVVMPSLSPSALSFLTLSAAFAALEWFATRRGGLRAARRGSRTPQMQG